MNKYKFKITIFIIISSFLISCSKSSKEIVGLYVSPLQYADYSCDQIKSEMIRVSTRVKSLTGELDENKENCLLYTSPSPRD